jgi:hypothetical protein
VTATTVLVGSLDALVSSVRSGLVPLAPGADVLVVPTAAAFTGLELAATEIATALAEFDVTVEALMVARRPDAQDPALTQRLCDADLVVLSDGSSLHAKSVWHETPVGEGIRDARRLVAVGSVATVLGGVMIDPRGGAPTMGLGYRPGVVVGSPESPEQLARTRTLLGPEVTFALLGPRGVLAFDERWFVVHDVPVTRGDEVVEL